jgi:lipopolysaccharide transport system ATP-binding protein
MSDIAIKVENLSKRYRIGLKEELPDTFIGAMKSWLKAPLDNLQRLRQLSHFSDNGHDPDDVIWALKDVSFEIERGEVVGIIGRNGAGKSTLLKILSRITEPTSGRAIVNGRISSLLEVGTGFHPELTGRENVYLNGTILGMSKREIDRKFDEIVAFAEVAKFIDTPVKRYSSGMQVRLAFAVAAHLEPEILLVDEVLAVGDISFQKKCLGKMGDVAKSGRTVLFVSHNMAAIQRLCDAAILLNWGQIKARGAAAEVTELYLQGGVATSLCWQRQSPPTSSVYFQKVYLSDEAGEMLEYVTTGISLRLVIEFVIEQRYRDLRLTVDIVDSNGDILFISAPQDVGKILPCDPGRYQAEVYLPKVFMARTYEAVAYLWAPKLGRFDQVNSLHFLVQETDSWSNSILEGRPGRLAIQCNWAIENLA